MADFALTAALAKKLGGGGGGGGGGVEDVKVGSTSIVDAQGTANVPILPKEAITTYLTYGVGLVPFKHGYRHGFQVINGDNGEYWIALLGAQEWGIKQHFGNGASGYGVIDTYNVHLGVFYALARLAGADLASDQTVVAGVYPETAKSAISQMLNAPETVSGSTPSITAKPGVQYICGEVSTIDITVPESGIIDVIFESGSTPAVLTVTPPTGVTMKWPDWFDPTALEANKVYEVNIMNGRLATVMVW